MNLRLEACLAKILDPAVGLNEREVGAEQHFGLELAVGVTHELRRKIFRAPAREVDIDVGLVQSDRERLVLPRPGGMGDDDRHVREVGGDVVEVNRVRIFEAQAAAARHACSDAGMAAVKDGRQLVLGDRLIEAIGHAVVGKEALQGRVKFEPLDHALLNEAARLAHPHLALVRIDRGEGHHDIRVRRGGLRDFVVRNASRADFELAVDREHDEADLALAIVGDSLGNGRALADLEILARGGFVGLPESVGRLAA